VAYFRFAAISVRCCQTAPKHFFLPYRDFPHSSAIPQFLYAVAANIQLFCGPAIVAAGGFLLCGQGKPYTLMAHQEPQDIIASGSRAACNIASATKLDEEHRKGC